VHNPGPFAIPDGSTLTVSQAIVNAGGTVADADLMKCTVVRRDAAGKILTTPFDLGKIMSGKAKDVQVARGDVIFVPTKGTSGNSGISYLGAAGGLVTILNFLK
jgi:protein involved in polysaccharide export with SLBB domain